MLIAVGTGFGLVRGLRALSANIADRTQLDLVKARIDALDLALARLGEQANQVNARLNDTITQQELSQILDRFFGNVESEVDARLEGQTGSIEALRLMVGQTDELLQRVLDGLESIRNDRVLAETQG